MIQYQALEQLVGSDLAQRWHNWLVAALRRYAIREPTEVRHFLAQILHESIGLSTVEEIWGPTAAQAGYEGRADLGNTEPGDGYRYRGRGPIQLTGRSNYRAAAEELGFPLETAPDLVLEERIGALVAARYWARRVASVFDDPALRSNDGEDLLRAVTRRVNGGLNGLDARRDWLARVEAAWPAPAPAPAPPPPPPPTPPDGAYGTVERAVVIDPPWAPGDAELAAAAITTGRPLVLRGAGAYRVFGTEKIHVRRAHPEGDPVTTPPPAAGSKPVYASKTLIGLAVVVAAKVIADLAGATLSPETLELLAAAEDAGLAFAAYGRIVAKQPIA